MNARCNHWALVITLTLGTGLSIGGNFALGADDSAAEAIKPAAAETALSVEELAARARRSVVVVSFSGRDGERQGLGAGFIVSSDGLIATNLHVIGEGRPIAVRLADGKEYDVTSIHATERSWDLAVLKVDAKHLPALELGDSDTVKDGQPVVAMGNPFGLEHSVVSGVVSGRREIDGRSMIQLAIPIERGNSGGPLLDMHGRVQGILTLKSLVTENLGFAVGIDALKPLLEKPNPIPMSRWLTIGQLDPRQWKPLFGARWRQRAGRIFVEGPGKGFGGRSLALTEMELPKTPFEITVDVKLDQQDGAAGLVFHADGGNRHYGFYPSSGKLRLSRFDGPDVYSWQVLREVSSRHYQPGDWNTLKVRLEKDVMQCFVNDELVIESTDNRYTAGKVGLAKFRHTEAAFKGFAVAKELPPSRPSEQTVARITDLVSKLPTDRPPTTDLADKLLPEAKVGPVVLRERARELERQADRLRQLAELVNIRNVQTEMVRLLKKDEDEIDLLHAALLIARLDNDELDVDAYLRIVGRIAEEIAANFQKDADERQKLQALNEHLFDELGFHGSRNNYYHRSNSYLNEVIDDREGLPITLSVLYMELARRIGLKVVGVGLPGHFVVRFEPSKGEGQLIDVFDRGAFLSREDAAAKVRAIAGTDLRDEFLQAQPKRDILVRMLRNLMGLARDENDAEGMLRYVDTMVAIDPEYAETRWFRAVLHFQTGRIDEAIEDTDWLLEREPEGIELPRAEQLRRLLEESRKERG